MNARTIRMSLVKQHKTLAEYAMVDAELQPILKPPVSPIYIRIKEFEVNGDLPMHFHIVMTPTYAE